MADKLKVFIGVDPGIMGGIACIRPGIGITADTMPKDANEIVSLFQALADQNVELPIICIEKVHSSPQMGVSGAFTFGRNYGQLEAAICSIAARIEYVAPMEWQNVLNCRTQGNKTVSLQKARELYPEFKVTRATADALLIAYYAWKRYEA